MSGIASQKAFPGSIAAMPTTASLPISGGLRIQKISSSSSAISRLLFAMATASAFRGKARYQERLNTDSALYGGSNVGNLGAIEAQDLQAHGFAFSLLLTLPPLAVVVLRPEKERW